MYCAYQRQKDGTLLCSQCGDKTTRIWSDDPPLWPKRFCGKPLPPGPGTILRALFHRLGLIPCSACLELAKEMDEGGIQWCADNRDYLVEKIKENVRDLSWRDWFLATGAAARAGYISLGQMLDEAIEQARILASSTSQTSQ